LQYFSAVIFFPAKKKFKIERMEKSEEQKGKLQSLLTKFFRPHDDSKPYYSFLFEKEAAERKRRQEEEMKR
jgi:hypothetical protein